MLRSLVFGGAIAITLAGCYPLEFDPPDAPKHNQSEDGALHAARREDPFACGDPSNPDSKRGVSCPLERPTDDNLLSCDTAGCHGGFDYTDATRNNRHLYGSDGPSCYSCHGEKWKDD